MDIIIWTFTIGKNKTFICENLENAGPLEQKCTLIILLGFEDNKVLLKYMYFYIFYSAQKVISNDIQI